MEEQRITRSSPSGRKSLGSRKEFSSRQSPKKLSSGQRHLGMRGEDEMGDNKGIEYDDDDGDDDEDDDGEDEDDRNPQDEEYMRFLASMFTVGEEEDRYLLIL